MLRVFLFRHGRTAANDRHVFSGRGDIPLSSAGRAQFECWHKLFRGQSFTEILCSPLARARQSAEVLAGERGIPLTVVPGLIELDFGRWEGLPYAEIAHLDPVHAAPWHADPWHHAPPEGETLMTAAARIAEVFDDVLAPRLRSTTPTSVALITHTVPLKLLILRLLDWPQRCLNEIHLVPGGCSIIDLAFGPRHRNLLRCLNLLPDGRGFLETLPPLTP